MVPTSTLLICTVGGSPAPLIASIRHWKPQQLILIFSESSLSSLPQIKQDCADIAAIAHPGSLRLVTLLDPQDFNSAVQDILELRPIISAWSSSAPEHRLIADFTGGTKVMSAALAVVAQHWPCEFSYVGGDFRDKGGVGIVIDGKEHIIRSVNPADALGRPILEEALSLFDSQGAYAAAADRLKLALARMQSPARKVEFSALAALFDAYAAWHRFDHKAAARYFQTEFPKAENNLKAVLGTDIFQSNRTLWKESANFLSQINQASGPTKYLIADLLANADRCARFGLYDDAVARLYRATEAFGQLRLAGHGFTDSSKVPLSKLPPIFTKNSHLKPDTEGRIKLGLQEGFRLLLTLNDEAGERFHNLDLEGQESPLVARNSSLLAHGFEPVTKKAFEALKERIWKLTVLDANISPLFPSLRVMHDQQPAACHP
jgi:CRISPR-associated protein (TIGR02710 family)